MACARPSKGAASRSNGPQPASRKRPIEQYDHRDKRRANNPPVGLVTPATDRDSGKKQYAYDPHLDPSLQWAGKAERLSFEVPTVSLHVHGRIDPKTVMDVVRRKNGSAGPLQRSLFEAEEEKRPLREALDFYKHAHSWSNRMIAGDSLLVMNSLLEKEGMAGKVQMVYIALWMLDTDYDGRSLYPRQVFFPMADADGGWARLARNLRAEIDEQRIEAYRGTVSLPFDTGSNQRVAVKIVDDRGIESLWILPAGAER